MPDSSVPESGFKIIRVHIPVWKGLATITEQISFINLGQGHGKDYSTLGSLVVRHTVIWSLSFQLSHCVLSKNQSHFLPTPLLGPCLQSTQTAGNKEKVGIKQQPFSLCDTEIPPLLSDSTAAQFSVNHSYKLVFVVIMTFVPF